MDQLNSGSKFDEITIENNEFDNNSDKIEKGGENNLKQTKNILHKSCPSIIDIFTYFVKLFTNCFGKLTRRYDDYSHKKTDNFINDNLKETKLKKRLSYVKSCLSTLSIIFILFIVYYFILSFLYSIDNISHIKKEDVIIQYQKTNDLWVLSFGANNNKRKSSSATDNSIVYLKTPPYENLYDFLNETNTNKDECKNYHNYIELLEISNINNTTYLFKTINEAHFLNLDDNFKFFGIDSLTTFEQIANVFYLNEKGNMRTFVSLGLIISEMMYASLFMNKEILDSDYLCTFMFTRWPKYIKPVPCLCLLKQESVDLYSYLMSGTQTYAVDSLSSIIKYPLFDPNIINYKKQQELSSSSPPKKIKVKNLFFKPPFNTSEINDTFKLMALNKFKLLDYSFFKEIRTMPESLEFVYEMLDFNKNHKKSSVPVYISYDNITFYKYDYMELILKHSSITLDNKNLKNINTVIDIVELKNISKISFK